MEIQFVVLGRPATYRCRQKREITTPPLIFQARLPLKIGQIYLTVLSHVAGKNIHYDSFTFSEAGKAKETHVAFCKSETKYIIISFYLELKRWSSFDTEFRHFYLQSFM